MSDNIFGTASTPSLVSVAEAAAKVMKLDEHCGVCDEQGLEEKVNLKKLKKDYLKNEDENRHTENYLMLAKAFGTPAEVKKVQEIMKRNEKQGSTSKTDSDWMYKNINKYYDKIRNEEVEIDEAVLADRDYKYDGKVVKISKKNFSKVHKDFKNSTKGKERMMINDPKTGGSISVPVQFEEVELVEKEVAVPPTIDNLKKIVKDKQNQIFMFKDGKARVDAFSASAMTQVYNALKPATKKKFEDMIKTKAGFMKSQAFAMKMLEGVEFDLEEDPDLEKIVKELEGASKMHLGQSKRIQKHLDKMKKGEIKEAKNPLSGKPFEDLRGVADVALKIMQGQPQEVKEEDKETVDSEENPQTLTE